MGWDGTAASYIYYGFCTSHQKLFSVTAIATSVVFAVFLTVSHNKLDFLFHRRSYTHRMVLSSHH